MKGRARVRVPTQRQVESLIADIEAIEKRLEAFTVMMTAAERLAITKIRPGGAAIVATLANVAAQRRIKLEGLDPAAMTAHLKAAERLRPVAEASRRLLKRLDDTITNSQSECWWSATALYSVLLRIAPADGQLEAALRPVVEFFAVGRRRKGVGAGDGAGAVTALVRRGGEGG